MPSNTPPMTSATGTPAPIEGAGAPCSTHETDEQVEGAAWAVAIPMMDDIDIAIDFMCASREVPNLASHHELTDQLRINQTTDHILHNYSRPSQRGNAYYCLLPATICPPDKSFLCMLSCFRPHWRSARWSEFRSSYREQRLAGPRMRRGRPRGDRRDLLDRRRPAPARGRSLMANSKSPKPLGSYEVGYGKPPALVQARPERQPRWSSKISHA
jgi:hypothetical protein